MSIAQSSKRKTVEKKSGWCFLFSHPPCEDMMQHCAEHDWTTGECHQLHVAEAMSALVKHFPWPSRGRVWVRDTQTKTYIVYCNIFCIINIHLHLPIKPPNPEKRKKKVRDEGRRGSDWRSSVHEPRTVEVALLIIGTYQKKRKKKTPQWGKKLIIRSFAWWLFFCSPLSVLGLFSSPPPSPLPS